MVFSATKNAPCSPMVYVMQADEKRNGRTVFDGSNAPFKTDDLFFARFPVLSWNKRHFWIVAVASAYQGQGLMDKLTERAIASGRTPHMIEPVGHMIDWLNKRNWKRIPSSYANNPNVEEWISS